MKSALTFVKKRVLQRLQPEKYGGLNLNQHKMVSHRQYKYCHSS